MSSPYLSRKPNRQQYSPSSKLISSRISGEQCCPIVYISPTKKNQNAKSKLTSYIESTQSNKILDVFSDNTKLKEENTQLKQKIKKLEDSLAAMKQKLKQSDCNIVQLTNNLYSTGQQLFAKKTIHKNKVRVLSHQKQKANLQDLAIVQSIQLKQSSDGKNSQIKSSKQLRQNRSVLTAISNNRMSDAEQLKQANKTIAQLRLTLDTANVNLKILQHKLEVKEQFIEKLKIRECQKLTNHNQQFDEAVSKNIDLVSSVNSFDLAFSRQIGAKSIKSNLPQFERTQLGQSINSYYNFFGEIK